MLFASQASTLKIDSKRNEVYTMTPSVDKGKFQTPTKGLKGDLKRTITPGKGKIFLYDKGSTTTIVAENEFNRSLLRE